MIGQFGLILLAFQTIMHAQLNVSEIMSASENFFKKTLCCYRGMAIAKQVMYGDSYTGNFTLY